MNDEDTVVDLPRLQFWIEHKFRPLKETKKNAKLEYGVIMSEVKPSRNETDKLYVSMDQFPAKHYPKFLYGDTYLMTAEAVFAILDHSTEVIEITPGDVLYTGILADLAGVVKIEAGNHFSVSGWENTNCEKVNVTEKGGSDNKTTEIRVPQLATRCKPSASPDQLREAYRKLAQLKC